MRRPVVIIGTLVLLAAALTGVSGATFTDGAQEPSSVFTGGTLDLSAAEATSSHLDASHMRPGQTRQAVLAVRNSGSVSAVLSAGIRDRADAPAAAGLSSVLELRVEDCGAAEDCARPTVAYASSLHDFSSATIGDLAPGATRYVRVSLVWGATKDDPSRQGATTSATLVWQAVAGSAA